VDEADELAVTGLWQFEDLARVHLSVSGTLLETLTNPDFQRQVYGTVVCGSLAWHLQNTRVIDILGTGYHSADGRARAVAGVPDERG
jgi:hypothetical protein